MSVDNAYEQTIAYLYAKLPMFSRIGAAALKPDLTNTIKLCAALSNPQNSFPTVHIAGTNGKGSTSHAIAAAFQRCGYKTGLYTSPHLLDFRERIRIDGAPVSKQWVVDFTNNYKDLMESVMPSFFEITVAMAFQAFAEARVDVAVIETGLGGRLDSTNIIMPLLSVITNISYDHKELLGNTLAEIAAEKAGIMKHDVPCVIGEQHDETEQVFFKHSVQKHSPLYYADAMWDMIRIKQDAQYTWYKAVDKARMTIHTIQTDLTGNYQQQNIKTVLTALELLSHKGFNLPLDTCIQALALVKQLTGLRGRWEFLQQNPPIICDVAHNTAGLSEVLQQLRYVRARTRHIVVGFVKDKDIEEALKLFPTDAVYYFCNAQIARALPAKDLQVAATKFGLTGNSFATVKEAFAAAKQNMTAEDVLLITGSFFVVGEAME